MKIGIFVDKEYWCFSHIRMKTDEVFHQKMNNSKTKRFKYFGSSNLFKGRSISHLMKKGNSWYAIRNEPEIIVGICDVGFVSFTQQNLNDNNGYNFHFCYSFNHGNRITRVANMSELWSFIWDTIYEKFEYLRISIFGAHNTFYRRSLIFTVFFNTTSLIPCIFPNNWRLQP